MSYERVRSVVPKIICLMISAYKSNIFQLISKLLLILLYLKILRLKREKSEKWLQRIQLVLKIRNIIGIFYPNQNNPDMTTDLQLNLLKKTVPMNLRN